MKQPNLWLPVPFRFHTMATLFFQLFTLLQDTDMEKTVG